jgi:hypothetical protein
MSPGRARVTLTSATIMSTDPLSIDRRRADADDLAAVLISGGDSRLRLDRITGLNRYFCTPRPSLGTVGFASCTASPISVEGWRIAGEAWSRLRPSLVSTHGRDALQSEAARLATELGSLLGTTGLAAIFLTPSGTDATMLAIGLLAAERPGEPIVSVMAAAAETGAGVPLAAAGRHFSDIAAGMGRVETGALLRGLPPGMRTVHVALRHPTGAVRGREEVDAEFASAAAAAAARGRPVVHLIDGSKTGLRAPFLPPSGADVIVDACQGRIPLARLQDYLLRGWPVLLTGSKFYGGPSFCGAVLFPLDRLAAIDFSALPAGFGAYCSNMNSAQPAANAGTILRWTVAVEEVRRFTSVSAAQQWTRIAALSEHIGTWIASTPTLEPVSMPEEGEDPQAWPRSIHTFAVRDPMDHDRLLTISELRSIYRELARDGVLVGQPVGIGSSHGGLRIAIGAATLHDSRIEENLRRLFRSLERQTRLR